jgi:hypothetical protein
VGSVSWKKHDELTRICLHSTMVSPHFLPSTLLAYHISTADTRLHDLLLRWCSELRQQTWCREPYAQQHPYGQMPAKTKGRGAQTKVQSRGTLQILSRNMQCCLFWAHLTSHIMSQHRLDTNTCPNGIPTELVSILSYFQSPHHLCIAASTTLLCLPT